MISFVRPAVEARPALTILPAAVPGNDELRQVTLASASPPGLVALRI
jgi:hypothetical protein